jgi:hypothetical protein
MITYRPPRLPNAISVSLGTSLPSKCTPASLNRSICMQLKIPGAGDPVPADYARLLDSVDRLADRLDCQFRIPWTGIRFGWDPIVGIVPIAGDLIMAAVSLKIIAELRQLGADHSLMRRMLCNVFIDTSIGLVPIVGPIFDLFYRANIRNVALLTDEIRKRRNAAD